MAWRQDKSWREHVSWRKKSLHCHPAWEWSGECLPLTWRGGLWLKAQKFRRLGSKNLQPHRFRCLHLICQGHRFFQAVCQCWHNRLTLAGNCLRSLSFETIKSWAWSSVFFKLSYCKRWNAFSYATRGPLTLTSGFPSPVIVLGC